MKVRIQNLHQSYDELQVLACCLCSNRASYQCQAVHFFPMDLELYRASCTLEEQRRLVGKPPSLFHKEAAIRFLCTEESYVEVNVRTVYLLQTQM